MVSFDIYMWMHCELVSFGQTVFMISFSSKACFFTSSSKYIEAILDCIK